MPTPPNSVVVAGVSHSATPTHTRERFHLTLDQAGALAEALSGGEREAAVLATCNRTEIYLTGSDMVDTQTRAACALAAIADCAVDARSVLARSNEAVARHLFSVAAGLESIVLGDTHVAAQVRRAHAAARAAGATGPLLDRLFESASKASKRVRSETSVSSGAASVPAAAVATAARIAAPLRERRVLVVGAGRIARAAALHARARGCRNIVVVNRTGVRASELAVRVGGRAVPMDRLRAELECADVVICTTGSSEYVLTESDLDIGRPIAVFDIALPRDVHPAFRSVTQLYDLDDLAGTVAASGVQRRGQLVHARAIVRDEAAQYESWRRVRSVAPAIAALRGSAERARCDVLKRRAGELAQLAASDRELVEAITRQLVRRLTHEPTLELRRQALAGDQLSLTSITPTTPEERCPTAPLR